MTDPLRINQPLCLNNVLVAQSMPDFDCQSFPCEDIDNRQDAELFAIAKLIMDEVEALCLIRPLRLAALFTMND